MDDANRYKIMALWAFWDARCLDMQHMSIAEAADYTLKNIENPSRFEDSSVKPDFRHYRTAQRDGSSVKALTYRQKSLFNSDGLGSSTEAAIEFVDKYFQGSYPTGKVSSAPEQYREAYAACHELLHSSKACCTACEKVSKKAGKLGARDATTDTTFSRQTIEEAMDAYDRFRDTGEHGEIFGAFDEPVDYWVRSTRERANRVYPTKPLVGFILKKTRLIGGWSQKTDAAARLYNAGFIIVDKDDQPVIPPERDG